MIWMYICNTNEVTDIFDDYDLCEKYMQQDKNFTMSNN